MSCFVTALCEVFHRPDGVQGGNDKPYLLGRKRVIGRDPDGRSYRSFASFNDPDGNGWLLQEITARLPGRGLSLNVRTLTELLRETETRHGGYEPAATKHHWSSWYAAYIVARQNGRSADEATKEASAHVEGASDRSPA
jgi:hypothetical protein